MKILLKTADNLECLVEHTGDYNTQIIRPIVQFKDLRHTVVAVRTYRFKRTDMANDVMIYEEEF